MIVFISVSFAQNFIEINKNTKILFTLHVVCNGIECLSPSLIYLAIDMYPERFQSLRRWKSQPDVVITRAQIGKAVRVALINQFTVNIVFAVVFYLLIQWRGLRLDAAQFPSALTVLRDFAVFLACEEVGFYYGHRLSHHPRLYASIHKVRLQTTCCWSDVT